MKPPIDSPARPLWQTFAVFLGPLMLSNILQSLSGTLNNIFLGQMIGVQAMAAASAFFPIIFFFISFVMGLGAGSSVLIGQAWGARNLDKVQAVAGATLSAALLVAVTIGGLGIIFARPLMVALATPPEILEQAILYGRVIMLGAPVLFLFILSTSMMRGVGDTLTPLRVLVVTTILGLGLTPALIKGWLGLPPMGVVSAAWASLVSQLVAMIWLAIYLIRKGHPLAPTREFLRHLRPDPILLKLILRIGLPTAVQMVIMSLAEIALLGLANGYGTEATAAYGAVNQVLAYVQFPAMSIAITSSILASHAIGAGDMARVNQVAKTGLLMNVIFTGGFVVLCYVFSRAIVGAFITSAPVVELTQGLLHIVLWAGVFFGMAGVFSAVMRASGTVLQPTALMITAILAVELPVAWFLSHRIGIQGVWWGYPAAFCAMFLLQATYYTLVWRKKEIKRLV
ncbi:MAG: MATE family efflux transporter [Caulobacteraceae bacterium]